MSEADPQRPESDEIAPPGSETLDELRRLLFGGEQERLREVEQRLDERKAEAEEVADVLDAAIRQSTARSDRLAKALSPTIEDALGQSVRRNPKAIADAIAPALGPAIRKSIRQAFAAMVEGMNHVLENTFSARGMRWRLEAYRTGRPFSEVALLHSLVYRVEQVFLIHRSDGVVLSHVVAPAVTAQDADMVAGMLSAIRRFAADSFGRASEKPELAQVELGELTLEIAEAPEVLLALVVRGVPPASLRARLEEQLELVHATAAEALADFTGDDTPFEAVRPLLEELLEQELRGAGEKKRGALLPILGAVLLLALVAGLARRILSESRHAQEFDDLLTALAAEPGLFVVHAERDGDGFEIRGMRDPAARDPRAIAVELGLAEARLAWTWEPYQSLDPSLLLPRVRAVLAPPATIALALGADGVLRVEGTAPAAWIDGVAARALALGVAGVDVGAVVAEDAGE